MRTRYVIMWYFQSYSTVFYAIIYYFILYCTILNRTKLAFICYIILRFALNKRQNNQMTAFNIVQEWGERYVQSGQESCMMLIYEWTLSRQYLINLHWQRFAFQTVGKIYKIRSKGCLSKQITFKGRLGKQLCLIKFMCKTKTRKTQQSKIWNCSKNYCENKKGLGN